MPANVLSVSPNTVWTGLPLRCHIRGVCARNFMQPSQPMWLSSGPRFNFHPVSDRAHPTHRQLPTLVWSVDFPLPEFPVILRTFLPNVPVQRMTRRELHHLVQPQSQVTPQTCVLAGASVSFSESGAFSPSCPPMSKSGVRLFGVESDSSPRPPLCIRSGGRRSPSCHQRLPYGS